MRFVGVDELELASGLKDLLIENGFLTVSQLMEIRASELASVLGTDDYIARLVIKAAKNRARTPAEHFA